MQYLINLIILHLILKIVKAEMLQWGQNNLLVISTVKIPWKHVC